tara:strand:+ start:363 stop:467 length:105 start_codon:yes stop_codon:yes gene_type:complete
MVKNRSGKNGPEINAIGIKKNKIDDIKIYLFSFL